MPGTNLTPNKRRSILKPDNYEATTIFCTFTARTPNEQWTPPTPLTNVDKFWVAGNCGSFNTQFETMVSDDYVDKQVKS